jgi:large subunit ribosomal protein L18
MKKNKSTQRQKIRFRIRKKISGTADCPRLSVFKSNTGIYCQVIDDVNGRTLCGASSFDKSIAKGSKTERAKKVGEMIAQKAKDIKIDSIVFDRSGYLYHGRIKALADGAREGGLQF